MTRQKADRSLFCSLTSWTLSLDDASDWLDLYFDRDSAQVRGAKATIAEIREGMFTVSPPDISQSLRLLREFNSINESAQ